MDGEGKGRTHDVLGALATGLMVIGAVVGALVVLGIALMGIVLWLSDGFQLG